jgi:NADH-quinone oxidoreductase subunit J
MTASQIIFLLVAVLAIGSAIAVVTAQNLIRAALWLIAVFFWVAGIFGMLNADFIAVTQVMLYIGGIAVLILFAVMLTRKVMHEPGSRYNDNLWLSALLAVLVLAGILAVVLPVAWPTLQPADVSGNVRALGLAFVDKNQYLLPFEIASILLIAALIGAVAIALPTKEQL